MNVKKILVTGGTVFVSKYVAEYYYLQDKLTAALFAAVSPMEILDAMEEYYEIFGSPQKRRLP